MFSSARKGMSMSRSGRQSFLRLTVAVIALAFSMSILAGSARAQSSYDGEELEFLRVINEYRENNGLPALILSDALSVASERHDEDMARYNFFAHETLGSSYFPINSEPWDRMALSGYDYPDSYRAENLAAGYETAEEAFEAWRTSPGHNVNMLDAKQRVIGVARIQEPDSYYGWYWTTDFGSELDPTSHARGEAPSEQRSSRNEEDQRKQPERDRQGSGRTEGDGNKDGAGVENGSMDKDGVWEQKTTREGYDLTGEGVAQLGGYDGAKDELLQRVRIKRGQKLTYRVRVETKETEHPADGLVIRLTDGAGRHLVSLKSRTDADARRSSDGDGWIEESVDLSRFAGRTVKLAFLAKTDEARPTTFYVDDVALK